MDLLLLSWVCVCGSVLTVVDIREHRLPNRWVAALGIGSCVIVAIDQVTASSLRLNLAAFTTAALVAASAMTVALLMPRYLGMGDAKLLLALIPLMSSTSPSGVLAGLWLTSVGAVVVLVLRRALIGVPVTRALAFGPFLLGSAVLAVALTG